MICGQLSGLRDRETCPELPEAWRCDHPLHQMQAGAPCQNPACEPDLLLYAWKIDPDGKLPAHERRLVWSAQKHAYILQLAKRSDGRLSRKLSHSRQRLSKAARNRPHRKYSA